MQDTIFKIIGSPMMALGSSLFLGAVVAQMWWALPPADALHMRIVLLILTLMVVVLVLTMVHACWDHTIKRRAERLRDQGQLGTIRTFYAHHMACLLLTEGTIPNDGKTTIDATVRWITHPSIKDHGSLSAHDMWARNAAATSVGASWLTRKAIATIGMGVVSLPVVSAHARLSWLQASPKRPMPVGDVEH